MSIVSYFLTMCEKCHFKNIQTRQQSEFTKYCCNKKDAVELERVLHTVAQFSVTLFF